MNEHHNNDEEILNEENVQTTVYSDCCSSYKVNDLR